MYCPNCGSENKKHLNYCRFCGLNLQEIQKTYLGQIVFGDESNKFRTLAKIKRFGEFANIFPFILALVGTIYWVFNDATFGKRLVSIGVGCFFLIQIIQQIIGYFQRRALRNTPRREILFDAKPNEFEPKETTKLIENQEQMFGIPSITEESTKMLPVERNTK